MVKVPHLWDFSPPPLPNKIAHAVPILHMELVLEGDFAFPRWGRFAVWYYSPLGKFCHRNCSWGGGGGENVCHLVLFPPGEVLLWDSAIRGRFFSYGIIFRGDNLPWYFFPYHENLCRWGGGGGGGFYHRWGKLYHMVLFPPWGSSAMGFIFPGGRFVIWYSFRGKSLLYGIIFGGGGGGRGNNSHVTPVTGFRLNSVNMMYTLPNIHSI